MDTLGIMYITDNGDHGIRRLNTTGWLRNGMVLMNVTLFADGLLSTFAGNRNAAGGFVDGVGLDARFSAPEGIAMDSNRNIYVADYFNNAIRKVTTGGSHSNHEAI